MGRRSSKIFFSLILVWVLGITPALVCACDQDSPGQESSHACCPDNKIEANLVGSQSGPELSKDCCVCFSEALAPVLTQESHRSSEMPLLAIISSFHRDFPATLPPQKSMGSHLIDTASCQPIFLKNRTLLL